MRYGQCETMQEQYKSIDDPKLGHGYKAQWHGEQHAKEAKLQHKPMATLDHAQAQ